MVVIDTSLIIDHLRQKPENSQLVKLEARFADERLAISLVTVQELYEGRSVGDKDKEREMVSVLAGLEILPYSYEVAKSAGKLNRNLSRPLDLADAAIAATAISNGAQLATLNKKDFAGIEELELI